MKEAKNQSQSIVFQCFAQMSLFRWSASRSHQKIHYLFKTHFILFDYINSGVNKSKSCENDMFFPWTWCLIGWWCGILLIQTFKNKENIPKPQRYRVPNARLLRSYIAQYF
jgi:hypothetical protein